MIVDREANDWSVRTGGQQVTSAGNWATSPFVKQLRRLPAEPARILLQDAIHATHLAGPLLAPDRTNRRRWIFFAGNLCPTWRRPSSGVQRAELSVRTGIKVQGRTPSLGPSRRSHVAVVPATPVNDAIQSGGHREILAQFENEDVAGHPAKVRSCLNVSSCRMTNPLSHRENVRPADSTLVGINILH